jgi:predicted component of type VI protein secretion system
MKKNITTFVILASVLTSCGPSAEQIANEEKRKLDSASMAGQNLILEKQAAAEAEANEAANQEALKIQLIELKSQLAGQEAKLNDTEQFKFLRTADEKAEQVAVQTKIIEELKAQILEIEKQIK